MYKLESGQAQFRLFSHLTFMSDLDLQPSWTNVLNGTSSPQGQQPCQIILKSMHKCTSNSLDKLNLWPFSHLTFKYDLVLQSTWTNVSSEQRCQIILKFMHKCTSYSQDKLLTFNCDLDLQPTWTIFFKWHFYSSRTTTVPNYFEIHA